MLLPAPKGPLAILSNVIDKFPFATDANATDVGDLTASKRGSLQVKVQQLMVTLPVVTSGIHVIVLMDNATDTIDKFPFRC